MFDSFAKKGDDLASEEKDIDLETGEEQDEKLAGPVLRSSGDSNLPKDGWNGDQDEEIEEEDELDEEADKQEGFSDNHDEDEEEEPTSVHTDRQGQRDSEICRQEVRVFSSLHCEAELTLRFDTLLISFESFSLIKNKCLSSPAKKPSS